MQTQKRALSWSAISQYMRCPRQYWYARVARKPTGPKNSALVEGSVGHSALEEHFKAKKASNVRPFETEGQIKSVVDYFEGFWDTAIQLEEIKWDKGEKDARKRAVRMGIEGYLKQVAPHIEPHLIEAEWRIELPECSFDLLGVCDIVDVNGAIWDHKFYARAPKESDVHEEGQLTCYDVARSRGAFGTVAMSEKLYLGVAVKGSQRATRIETVRTAKQRDWFIGQVIDVAKALDHGTYFPIDKGWHCSPQYCDFYSDCKGE